MYPKYISSSNEMTFLVDLIKYNDQHLYVQIIQTTHSEYKESTQHRIKINPKLLTDIISVLQTYKMSIEKAIYAPSFLIKNSTRSLFPPSVAYTIPSFHLSAPLEIKKSTKSPESIFKRN